MAATRHEMDEYLDHFMENGYVVVRGALSPEEVARINDGIDADRAAHPEEWVLNSRRGHDAVGRDAPGVMERTDALDGVVHHPSVIPIGVVARLTRSGFPLGHWPSRHNLC